MKESVYWLRCNPKLADYYLSMGFKVADDIPYFALAAPEGAAPPPDDLVLRADRATFVKVAATHFTGRRGYPIWAAARVKKVPAEWFAGMPPLRPRAATRRRSRRWAAPRLIDVRAGA